MKRAIALILTFLFLCAVAFAEAGEPIRVPMPGFYNTLELAEDMEMLPKPENYEELVAAKDSGSVSIYCPSSAKILFETGTVDFWYEQQWLSSHDVFIQIILTDDNGNEVLVSQSGLVPKGHRLNSMVLSDEMPDLEDGEYAATLRLFFFDDTSEVAAMGSQLALRLIIGDPEMEGGSE